MYTYRMSSSTSARPILSSTDRASAFCVSSRCAAGTSPSPSLPPSPSPSPVRCEAGFSRRGCCRDASHGVTRAAVTALAANSRDANFGRQTCCPFSRIFLFLSFRLHHLPPSPPLAILTPARPSLSLSSPSPSPSCPRLPISSSSPGCAQRSSRTAA